MTDQQPHRPSAAELAAAPPLPPSFLAEPTLANGLVVSSYGRRVVAHILDSVLFVVLLVVGYFAWAAWSWGRGQSPGKQLMGMRVVDARSGDDVTWGRMFTRELLLEILLFSVVSVFTFGLLGFVGTLLIFGGQWRQTGWDRMAKTVVVDVPR